MKFVKRMLMVLILLVARNLETFSQNTADSTIYLPIKDARAAVKIIQSLRIDSMLLVNDKRILSERITAREVVINTLRRNESTYKGIITNYEKQVLNNDKALKLSQDLSAKLSKEIKRANTKTVLVGVIGLALSVLILVK